MTPQRNTNATLIDLLDRVLDKDLVIHADLIVSVAGIPLIGVNLRVALAGMETMLEYGIMQVWDEKTRAWERENRKEESVLSERLAFTGRIAASIAHEIRNPLTNVSMSVRQLKDAFSPDGRWARHIEIIIRNTERKISRQLDSDGRDILWYLWENGHARINRLAELIQAPNHMHVLLLIRGTINPVAEKELECPIFSFEKEKLIPKQEKSSHSVGG